jgi:hypothetical protein
LRNPTEGSATIFARGRIARRGLGNSKVAVLVLAWPNAGERAACHPDAGLTRPVHILLSPHRGGESEQSKTRLRVARR